MGHFFSEQHYEAAFEQMDEMLMLRDGRTVDYLILLALYCTRAPRDPGAWYVCLYLSCDVYADGFLRRGRYKRIV
jgi:hypothetical protein